MAKKKTELKDINFAGAVILSGRSPKCMRYVQGDPETGEEMQRFDNVDGVRTLSVYLEKDALPDPEDFETAPDYWEYTLKPCWINK
jgi:hypothetical protein